MFYCNECAKKRKWPITIFRSYGACELCEKVVSCNSVKSKDLPISGKWKKWLDDAKKRFCLDR